MHRDRGPKPPKPCKTYGSLSSCPRRFHFQSVAGFKFPQDILYAGNETPRTKNQDSG
jgi:hypothetical protein